MTFAGDHGMDAVIPEYLKMNSVPCKTDVIYVPSNDARFHKMRASASCNVMELYQKPMMLTTEVHETMISFERKSAYPPERFADFAMLTGSSAPFEASPGRSSQTLSLPLHHLDSRNPPAPLFTAP